MKNERLAQMNQEGDGDPENPTAFAFYKSSYDGTLKAILPYLRKKGAEDKEDGKKTKRTAGEDDE